MPSIATPTVTGPPPYRYVYVVQWQDEVTKIGFTRNIRRFTMFTATGGTLVHLECAPDVATLDPWESRTASEQREAEMLRVAALIFPRAFSDKWEAEPYLGPGGSGWTECFIADNLRVRKMMAWITHKPEVDLT